MSSFSLHIATDNAAFWGGEEAPNGRLMAAELAHTLRAAADKLERDWISPDDVRYGANTAHVHDTNGNTCGRWFWTGRTATHDDAAALDRIVHLCENSTSLPPGLSFLAAIADVARGAGRTVVARGAGRTVAP